MNTDDLKLIAELERDEGVRYVKYKDSLGIDTTGVGHNLEAHPLPEGWTFPLSADQVRQLLASDLEEVFSDLDHHLPWWRNLSYARQRVVANMCFNLGMSRLLEFKNTLRAMQDGRYDSAAAGMLASKWASQVGARADRLADMMRAG